MKSKELFFFFSLILLLGVFSACGNDAVDCSNAATEWANDVNGELTAVSNAAAAYGSDPSQSNCDALKDAYQNYIDALGDWSDCLDGDQGWEQALADAQASISSIC